MDLNSTTNPVVTKGVHYHTGLSVYLNFSKNLPSWGIVKMIIVSNLPIISFVVDKYSTQYAPELRAYVWSRNLGLAIVKQTDLHYNNAFVVSINVEFPCQIWLFHCQI